MKIISQIQGGLGNQIFQYAMGKTLSHRLSGDLFLDTQWFEQRWEDVTPRHFLLPELKVQFQLALDLQPYAPPKGWRRLAQKWLPINPYLLKDRKEFTYDSNICRLELYQAQDLYLMGYWQSFRYFESIRKELLSEIKPVAELSAHYQVYLTQIQQPSSAMVHVRRGDYIDLASAEKVHGFLGLDYYTTAMGILLNRNPATQFFIFSDDIEWVKQYLPYHERSTFIEGAQDVRAPVEELFLMSQCHQHIIANSSLSWWGAWLSDLPDPKVIAPKHWTNDKKKNWNDLLPAHWQKI